MEAERPGDHNLPEDGRFAAPLWSCSHWRVPVAKFSLRRFENQALVSLVLSLLSVLTFAGLAGVLAFFLRRGLDAKDLVFLYGPRGKMAVLLAAAATLFLSAAGFGFGLNSAGQRRNDKQRLSWIGFFVGALILAFTLVLVFFFMQRGEQIIR
jgi:hypothetical protein